MLERYPQGRVATWLGRALGRVSPTRIAPTPPATKSLAHKSLTAPCFAFDRLGSPAWAPRDYAAFAREGFAQNAIVYRSVRMIAEAAASVPLLLYAGDEEIASHPLLDLLARPNAAATAPDLLEALYGFLLVSGNAYLEALPLGSDIRELHTLRPDRIKVVPGADGWPEAFDYTVDGRTRRLPREAAPGVRAVLHLKLFHPTNDHYGLSPIEAAASAIDIHNTASRWNKALLDNSARPSGALVYTARDGNLTIEQYDRLKAELEQGFQGAARAGRPLLLEGGLDWKSMSMSPKDMDFIEAKHVAAREIALALGVPPMLLGIPGDNTYSNYQEATRTFWRSTVLPLVTRTAKSLSAWLAPAYAGSDPAGLTPSPLELRPDIDSIEALSIEREALWTRVDKATFLTQNEKRAAVGYGSVDGGDALSQKANFNPGQLRIPLGRPAGGRWTDGDGDAGDSIVQPARRSGGRGRNTTLRRALDAARSRALDARRRVHELDPDWRGPESAFPLDSIEGQLRHEEAVEQAAEARLAEVLPRGFGGYENYAAFGQNLRDDLRAAGYHDVEPIFAGSAVTGRNYHTGQPFDVGRRSDYDIALASPTLMQRAIELGIPVRGVESRTRPLSADDLNNLGLAGLAQRLREQTGREVHFVIYRSRRAVARRGASRPIPGK